MKKTPDEVKIARAWLGLTQVELAAAMDTHVKSLQNMEQGIRPCRGPVAVLLDLMCANTQWGTVTSRPKYHDIEAEDWAACADYDTVELKYDGHYAELRAEPGSWELMNRKGVIVDRGSAQCPVCRVLIEHITGTEWANASPLRDKLIAWSAVDCKGKHLARVDFVRLVSALMEAGIDIEISDPHNAADDAEGLWAYAVMKRGWEGLVLRTKGGKFARMKCRVTVDCVVMGYEAGSILGGLYNKRGILTQVVRVPWSEEPHAGQVFEASGLAITKNGSLRNPRFERWRDDKDPRECVK